MNSPPAKTTAIFTMSIFAQLITYIHGLTCALLKIISFNETLLHILRMMGSAKSVKGRVKALYISCSNVLPEMTIDDGVSFTAILAPCEVLGGLC